MQINDTLCYIIFMKRLISLLILILCLCTACGEAPINEENTAAIQEAGTKLEFLFISDTQADEDIGDYTELGEVLSSALSDKNISFILHGGDAVNDGEDEDEWQNFHEAYDKACGKLAANHTFMAPGNHDKTGQPMPPSAILPQEIMGPKNGFYSLTFFIDSVHIMVMNSNYMGVEDEELKEWFINEMETNKAAKYHIALFHHPFNSSPDVPRDIERAKKQREIWEPLFEQYGIKLVLNGHQHIYTRNCGENGITYLMVATGSKPSYEVTPPEGSLASYYGICYTHFIYDASSEKLNGISYNKDGEIIDEFTVI